MEILWIVLAFIAGGVTMNYLGAPIKNWLRGTEKQVGTAVKNDITNLKSKL